MSRRLDTEEQREAKRAYEREWRRRKYAEDPEYRARKRATDQNWSRKLRQELGEYKREQGCHRCGYDKCARALVFHHREGKDFTIGSYLGKGRKAIWAEVERCDVLCSNCHAEEHCLNDC